MVLNDALVIIDLETVVVFVAGDNATLIPIGASPLPPKNNVSQCDETRQYQHITFDAT